jgi:hypothetical protein
MTRPTPNFLIVLMVLAMLAGLFAGVASAQTTPYNSALIGWVNATENTLGETLPIAPPNDIDALSRTEIYRSVRNADGTAGTTVQTISVVVPAGPLSVLFENLPDNTVQCFRARHFTFGGEQSALSGTVAKAIVPPRVPKKPRPPKNPRAD